MLDVARHFFDVAEVKRLIDLMALYKLNRLHLHLTDDQGWRIAVRSRPNLTRIGATTAVGGGPGGHYTRRQYAELVEHAAAGSSTWSPRSTCPATSTPRSRRTGAHVRRRRAPAVHGDRGRLQLALHSEGADLRLPGRCPPRARGAHAGQVPPRRRRRAALDRSRGLPLLRRARAAARSLARQARDPLGGGRAGEAPPDGGRAALARPGARAPRRRTGREARALAVEAGVPRHEVRPRLTPRPRVGRKDERAQGVRLGPRGRRRGDRRARRPRRRGAALVGDDLDPRRSRLAGVPAAARRRRGRLVARGADVAGVPDPARGARAPSDRARRRLPRRPVRAVARAGL